jgi:hypothetical protein
MVWNWMHTVIGLQKLGHTVTFVEEIKPKWIAPIAGGRSDYGTSRNRQYFRSTMKRFGLDGTSCQSYNRGEATTGLSYAQLLRVALKSDLLLNMSGHIEDEAILQNVGRRVYVDQDPVYTQLWISEYGVDLQLSSHDSVMTVGLNIGTPWSHIPDAGLHWHHMLPPVVPALWQCQPNASSREFTTVASWSTYGDLQYRGRWYRSKYDEFNRFSELPRHTDQPLAAYLKDFSEGDPDIRRLRQGGWVVERFPNDGDPDHYQSFLNASRAEIGIAKGAYVHGNSGWFGDRWAHYLIAGKPVLAQSTGFERILPVGNGLLSFATMEEAVAGVEAINSDYETHCRAARELAEEYLSYEVVLPRLVAEVMSDSRREGVSKP